MEVKNQPLQVEKLIMELIRNLSVISDCTRLIHGINHNESTCIVSMAQHWGKLC